ncbi:MAG: Gldg family protein [Deltaproteobacteria bacterium]|nr:Gldg family protein [Deltaproteobacteria bacterium]
MTNASSQTRQRIHRLWPHGAVLLGLAVLFIGERLAGSEPNLVTLGLGSTFLLAAVLARATELQAAPRELRPVLRRLLSATLGVFLAIGVYALIRFAFPGDSPAFERIRGALWVLMPIVLTVSILPLVAIEAATMPVAYNVRYEEARILRAYHRGLGLALFLSSLFVGNYIVATNDEKVDLAYGNQASASEATRLAVQEVTQPVKVVLFWPRANEVADRVLRYFEPLAKSNPHLTIERVDQALASELAQKAGVSENGYIAVLRENSKEKVRIGTDADSARSNLRHLDKSFLDALIKVSSSDKVVYFTVGHGERTWTIDNKEDVRPPIKLLKRQLEAWQYKVKTLGVGEGLATELPKDAGLIFIMGPEKPFLAPEIETLNKAISAGARVVIALEAERDGDGLEGLLTGLGLRFDKTILANETKNAPLTRTPVDNTYIWSNKYSSHASVTSLTRNDRLVTLLFKSGALVETKPNPALPGIKTDVVIRAMDGTFADLNGNFVFDAATEKKESWPLAVAVTKTPATSTKVKGADPKKDEGRVFVLADVDAFSDDLLQVSQGNSYLLRDIVLWLQVNDEPVVPTVADADKKIEHRRADDAYLFYGTTFGIPALILIAGLATVERRRRRS